MAYSLTPNPDTEAEDLATELSTKFVMRAIHQHGLSVTEFEMDMGWHGREWPRQPTLKELRDWLGY